MAASAQWDEPPPQTLLDAWDCLRFHTLLEDGGLMNQPMGSVMRMNAALNIYNSFKSRNNAADHVEWTNKEPDAWKIVAKIEKMRLLDGRTS